jgi:formate hydrogenlyase subunit 3/multisubunit Na+/H+ antiporter MnhD subunit
MIKVLLILAWLLPLLAAPVSLARGLWWLPAASALPALGAALWLPAGVQVEIPWLLLGSQLGLDEIGRVFLAFTAILWIAAGLYAAQSLKDQPNAGRFRAYFLLAMAGNLWLIVAQDLVGFYTGFALMGLASYGLVVHQGDRKALRAGRVYLSMTVVGELALFCALVLIAAHTGTLTPTPAQLVEPRDLTVGLLLLGLAIKAGLVPLHVWLPLAHPAAPVPASAVLSGAMIKVALLGWLRFLPVGEAALPEWGMLLLLAGLITLFFAIPIGLVQSDPKVILAYSSVSKMGFLTLILGLILLEPALAPGGVLAMAVYAAHHALAKGGLFLGVGLRHHAAAQPLVLTGLALLALSMAGTPASGGAVAKYGLKPVILGTGWSWLGVAVSLSALATVPLMARFLWVIGRTEPHPAKGYAWGFAAWGLLVLLVLLYPLVLGYTGAWLSGTGPVMIGIAISALVALVAWRKPRLLDPLVDRVSPGDLLALVRPVLAVLALLGKTLFRGWSGFVRRGRSSLREVLAPLARAARDPEARLRAWPNAGAAWLGITALLLVLLLAGQPRLPLRDASPGLATSTEEMPRPPAPSPEVGSIQPPAPPGEQTPDAVPQAITGETSAATAPSDGEEPPQEVQTRAAQRPPMPTPGEAVEATPAPEGIETASAEQPICRPHSTFILRHPSVPRPLELNPCLLDEGVPRLVPSPPLTNRLVELAQHHLRNLGYDPGPLDGFIGPRTLDAVRRFQRDQGLAATGVLSFEFLERLQAAAAQGPAPDAAEAGTPLQRGDGQP